MVVHVKLIFFFNIIGNSKLKNLYISSNIPIFHLKLGQSSAHMNDFEQTDKEHRAILKALIDKDLPYVEELLLNHLLRGAIAVAEI